MTSTQTLPTQSQGEAEHQPYVPDEANLPEFTLGPIIVGAILGIIFGASSLYLVLKVGLTVSASIPVAVLSITLFRVFSRVLGIRRATILENNIVQTTGSAGESIAFGVGVTMPALMLLGFDMHVVQVMTVGVLGSLLGILMMIPLRRAFIVKQHGRLTYPEGTACADVLIVGEQGGATATTVFAGFGLAFIYKFLMAGMNLWQDTINIPLFSLKGKGLRGAVLGGEVSPELLGVGYIIGPRIAATMLSGGVLAYLVIVPAIVFFSSSQGAPVPPSTKLITDIGHATSLGQIMKILGGIRNDYVLYIGAGAVAAGGLISMFQAMPLIFSSIRSGLRDMNASKGDSAEPRQVVPRTHRDLPLATVVFGCAGLVIALTLTPGVGLGVNFHGLVAALLIVFFAFLFVTVSSRLTGEIGSSSNPISGMTVATLLFTCLAFLIIGHTSHAAMLTAMTVAAVVCIAASNGGSTSQDLKTGYLVGATPYLQQYAIMIGALTSALVMGLTLLLLNRAGTVYTTRPEFVPAYTIQDVSKNYPEMERAGGQYAKDPTDYHVVRALEGQFPGVLPGKYLADDAGKLKYLIDPAINGRVDKRDDGAPVANKFEAPKTRLMALIVQGILGRKLPWDLVLMGVLIAIGVELLGVPSLPFAVGVYLPIQTSMPIFLGGAVRWGVTRMRAKGTAESDMSSGSLFSTGYIAGGTIAGVVIAFLTFAPRIVSLMDLSNRLPAQWNGSIWPAAVAFGLLLVVLLLVGSGLFTSPPPVAEHVRENRKT